MRGFELDMVGGNVEARRAREAASVVSTGRAPAPVLLDGKDLMDSMVVLGILHDVVDACVDFDEAHEKEDLFHVLQKLCGTWLR